MLRGCDEAWAGCVEVSIGVIVKSNSPMIDDPPHGRVLGHSRRRVMGTALLYGDALELRHRRMFWELT